ncbi:hypothetical protein [Caballeronia glebae]|jgi:hypothetical protein
MRLQIEAFEPCAPTLFDAQTRLFNCCNGTVRSGRLETLTMFCDRVAALS